jgi:type IV fimbrial biogenesis protein FimT
MHVLSRQRSAPFGRASGYTTVFRAAMRRHSRGFTLVELMITLTVAVVLTVIAVPSYRNMINSNRLTTAANEMVGALNLARMEAIKRNGNAQFCSNSAANNTTDALGGDCGTQGGAVYVLTTGTPAFTQVRASPASLASPVQLHGNMVAIRFNGQGLGYKAGTTSAPFDSTTANSPVVDLCTAALSSNNHIQISMAAGSIITTSTPSTGTCP